MKYRARPLEAILPQVSDHAVLRYLERRHNINVEMIRAAIAHHTAIAIDHDAPHVIWDGVRFVIMNGVVVTTLALDMRPKDIASEVHHGGRAPDE